MGDKGETSVNSCGPRHPDGRQGGDKCKLMRPKEPRVGDKEETSVNSCGPRNPVCETSVGDKWETSVNSCSPSGETSVGDKCKLMRPKAPRVRDKCGRQGGDKCKLMRHKEPRVGDKGETSVNSCGPRHPEWETRGRQV